MGAESGTEASGGGAGSGAVLAGGDLLVSLSVPWARSELAQHRWQMPVTACPKGQCHRHCTYLWDGSSSVLDQEVYNYLNSSNCCPGVEDAGTDNGPLTCDVGFAFLGLGISRMGVILF